MSTTLTAPKIELKNIKYAAFASEETSCYEATIYVDGVKFATVDNEGRGGPDRVRPFTGGYDALAQLDERIKRTMPRIESEYFPDGLEPSLEIICGDLVNEFLRRKDFKNVLKKIALLRPDGKIVTYPAKYKPTAENIRKSLEINPNFRCLNTMPEDEAFAIFSAI
jgi:hypothetical protein